MRCWQYTGSVKDKARVMNGGQHEDTVKTLLQSTTERRQSRTRRIKHDKEWLFVKPPPPFKWGQNPFQMGAKPLSNGGKNMEYWLKPLGEKEGWGRHPITMDCKMNECYSSTPQNSLLRSNEVTWLLVWWPMQNVNKIKRSLSFDSNQVIQLKIFPPSNTGCGKFEDALRTGSEKSVADFFAIISELCWRAWSYCNGMFEIR